MVSIYRINSQKQDCKNTLQYRSRFNERLDYGLFTFYEVVVLKESDNS